MRFAVRSLGGAQSCVGNSSTAYPVELREPLGTRRLMDSSVYPPRPVDLTEPLPRLPLKVSFFHCGVSPVNANGVTWEAPRQLLDDDPELPIDGTNQPRDWAGTGTAVIDDDRLTYTDGGGEVIDFVPDDGIPQDPCA